MAQALKFIIPIVIVLALIHTAMLLAGMLVPGIIVTALFAVAMLVLASAIYAILTEHNHRIAFIDRLLWIENGQIPGGKFSKVYDSHQRGATPPPAAQKPQLKPVVDTGTTIQVRTSRDRDVVVAALLAAKEKFNGSIELDGSDDYKRNVLPIAVELGIEVTNPELAAMQNELKAKRLAEQVRVAPPIAPPAAALPKPIRYTPRLTTAPSEEVA